jgi:hypothetical protein
MPRRKAIPVVLLALLSLIVAGCTKLTRDPPRAGPGQGPPKALAIVTSQPADLPAIMALVTGARCPREHLEVVDPNFNAGRLLYVSQAPAMPSMPGPVPPRRPGNGATQYLRQKYAHQLQQFRATLAADLRALEQKYARLYRAWAATAAASIAAKAPTTGTGIRLRAGLSDGTAYFASLNQAGAHLGPDKVIVIFMTGTTPGRMPPIRPDSLHGATVITVNFRAGQIRRAAWHDDLAQAGAAHTPILAPAAIGELPGLVRHAFGGCA